jgi:hypothetical protein
VSFELYPTRHKAPSKGTRAVAEELKTGLSAFVARIGIELDAVQARVLESCARRGILNCTRQWGKSTVTAAKAVHEAWSKPGSLTLVVSPTARQSGEFVRKASEFVQRLGLKPKGDGDNQISLVFPNGARIVGLPGTEATVRGFSAVSLLRVPASECARIDPGFLREELATMGDRWFRQEYGCEFTGTDDGVFDRDLVEGAMSAEFEPLSFH